MIAWLRDLNAKERRTMLACFGGWSLDAFDVQMYSFVIPTVIALWGLSRGEAGLIGTVTLLISSSAAHICPNSDSRAWVVTQFQTESLPGRVEGELGALFVCPRTCEWSSSQLGSAAGRCRPRR